jgi:DNA repair exonuclease SbcCD nuclease subunit
MQSTIAATKSNVSSGASKMFIQDLNLMLIGDPHLGRKFVTGVPLSRRGEREAMVWKQFTELCGTPNVTKVIMGDLFDTSRVPEEVMIRAYAMLREHATPAHPIFVLMGNHDMSRDTEKASSFELLKAFHQPDEALYFITEPEVYNGIAFLPYHPFRRSEEQLDLIEADQPLAAIGHWDLDSFGEMPHNIFPAQALLARGVRRAYTGHIHTPEVRTYEGVMHLVVTGSMQPYSFAEDPEGKLYVTLTLDELAGTDPSALETKCVRVILQEGDALPAIDCLQLVGKRSQTDDVEDSIEVSLESFDMQQIIHSSLSKAVSDQTILQEVLGFYQNHREAELNQ